MGGFRHSMSWVRPSREWPWRLFSCAGFLNEAVSMAAIDPLLSFESPAFNDCFQGKRASRGVGRPASCWPSPTFTDLRGNGRARFKRCHPPGSPIDSAGIFPSMMDWYDREHRPSQTSMRVSSVYSTLAHLGDVLTPDVCGTIQEY